MYPLYLDVKAHRRPSCDLQINAEAQRAATRQLRLQTVLQAVAASPAGQRQYIFSTSASRHLMHNFNPKLSIMHAMG